MLCRSVQEARPRASTSGGQSSGKAAGTFVLLPFVAGELEVSDAAMADQAAKEVQERQLESVSYLNTLPISMSAEKWAYYRGHIRLSIFP